MTIPSGLEFSDRVKQTSTTTGTGDFTLGAAVSNKFITIAGAGIADLTPVSYVIEHQGSGVGEWEVGYGWMDAGVFIRNDVTSSSNAGALVNFATGLKHVAVTAISDTLQEILAELQTGIRGVAYGGSGANLSAGVGLWRQASSGSVVTATQLLLTDIPDNLITSDKILSLDASKLSGTVAPANGGLGANTSGITGLIKLASGVASQAVAGTDYVVSIPWASPPPIGSTTPNTIAATIFSAKNTTDLAPLGVELTTNGTFTGSLTGWTGANWSASSNRALHTAGSAAALTQNIAVTIGLPYVLVVTTSGRTAGSVTPSIGAAAGTAISTNTTTTQVIYPLASGSVPLNFTPSSDFDGSLDDVSVKVVDAWASPSSILSTAAASVFEWRVNASNFFGGFNTGRYTYTGINNTIFGYNAYRTTASASNNTGFGFEVLGLDTTGDFNAGFGGRTLRANTTGTTLVAVGYNALAANTTGSRNTAVGQSAGSSVTTGNNNTYIGNNAGLLNTGSGSTMIGQGAGYFDTNSNRLYITNTSGSNLADGIAAAIIYGVMDSTPANQTLRLNAAVTIPLSTVNTSSVATPIVYGANSTGTPVAGFGVGLLATLESSTTDNRSASLLETVWNVATDSAAEGEARLLAYHNAAGTLTRRVGFIVRGGASATQWAIAGGTVAATETVTGSRLSGAALADLLTKLANKGIIIDGTVA